MRGQVPRLACMCLETLTPLHIGAGQGGGKPFEDQVLGGRAIPSEYRPPPRHGGPPQVVKIQQSQRRAGQPYIPASSLRGWLRGLYTGALEATGIRNPERKTEKLFGSTEMAGAIALNDLLADGRVTTFQTQLVRYLPATTAAGRQPGRSRQEFLVELVDKGASFTGEVLYVNDALGEVLVAIFAQSVTLTQWLRTGRGGTNPEMVIPGSPISGTLFQHHADQWTITWKLGRYAKSYAKALTRQRRIGQPHAYYLVQDTDEVPGWARITFDLAPQDEDGRALAEFRLNEWAEEGA
jgi:hypothetical protein